MIVTVVLDQLRLTPIADLTAGMAFELNAIEYDPAVFVTIGQYAAGNFRPRRQKGTQRTAKVTLVGQSDEQAQFLTDQQGAVLVLRDPRGRKFAGLYTDLNLTPAYIEDYWGASFTMTETTYSEAV